jgi:hypothetical protein
LTDRGAHIMKSTSLVGIVLVVLGVLALAYQGINYTRRETVLDVGPIHATADTEKHIPLPPIVGGLAILGGAFLLFARTREKS